MTEAGESSGRAAEARIAVLYAEHIPRARRLAYLLTGSREDAEDLAHEAFLRVVGRFADLRAPELFSAYLNRAVVNACRSSHRKSAVRRKHAALQKASTTVPAHDPSDRDALWAMLLRLPERQRAALVLRFYEDLSESAIADALRCRPGTVKSLLSRGLEALRAEVSNEPV